MGAWVSDMFGNFYLVKNLKIGNTSTTSKAREKNKHRFGILRILKMFCPFISMVLITVCGFDLCLTKFNNNQILVNKVGHRILLTTKPFYWMKDPHYPCALPSVFYIGNVQFLHP